jgi:hypothetical protein
MTVAPGTDLNEEVLFQICWGLIFKVVCAPKSWNEDKISEEATRIDPPGTTVNKWVVSEPDNNRSDDFKGVNNLPCPDDCNRLHWLINC